MRQASAVTKVPIPICTLANPWYWANSAPDSPTSPFESVSPTRSMPPTLTPCARAMVGLSPAARAASPSRVRKNQPRASATAGTSTARKTSDATLPALTSVPKSVTAPPPSRSQAPPAAENSVSRSAIERSPPPMR
jgi:hypothetical protein